MSQGKEIESFFVLLTLKVISHQVFVIILKNSWLKVKFFTFTVLTDILN